MSYDFLAPKGHDYFRQMLILNFHCNLDFGSRASTRGYQRINNEDKENGILSGTK